MTDEPSADNFPRIRGDGPGDLGTAQMIFEFSPYSRGWSCDHALALLYFHIFPVFAGMVRRRGWKDLRACHFPRIRGDGPTHSVWAQPSKLFSPYSRGWSPQLTCMFDTYSIFPVFAGMVPFVKSPGQSLFYFPRIRGDGPVFLIHQHVTVPFSPYSRGWSRQPYPRQR